MSIISLSNRKSLIYKEYDEKVEFYENLKNKQRTKSVNYIEDPRKIIESDKIEELKQYI